LESPDVFTEEIIVDELCDFLIAGTATTQMTTQTVLVHFATNKASLERVRAEFYSNTGVSKDLSYEEMARESITMENCGDLSYLTNVIYEALRVNSPAPTSSHLHFEKDTKIGGLHVKAYDPILINIYPMHYNSRYWQDPKRFNPDRFDPEHPDSLTPDGKKRPQTCWLPFNGGKRICFGKTFAEMVLKVITSMLSQRFNFELVEAGKYDERSFPLLTFS
jgi:cytochrome P450